MTRSAPRIAHELAAAVLGSTGAARRRAAHPGTRRCTRRRPRARDGVAAYRSCPRRCPTAGLRVCADPNNLPFSDRARDGFENRIATLMARELRLPVTTRGGPSGGGSFAARSALNYAMS